MDQECCPEAHQTELVANRSEVKLHILTHWNWLCKITIKPFPVMPYCLSLDNRLLCETLSNALRLSK